MLSKGLVTEGNGQFQFDFIKQTLPLLTSEEIYALADQFLVILLVSYNYEESGNDPQR